MKLFGLLMFNPLGRITCKSRSVLIILLLTDWVSQIISVLVLQKDEHKYPSLRYFIIFIMFHLNVVCAFLSLSNLSRAFRFHFQVHQFSMQPILHTFQIFVLRTLDTYEAKITADSPFVHSSVCPCHINSFGTSGHFFCLQSGPKPFTLDVKVNFMNSPNIIIRIAGRVINF